MTTTMMMRAGQDQRGSGKMVGWKKTEENGMVMNWEARSEEEEEAENEYTNQIPRTSQISHLAIT